MTTIEGISQLVKDYEEAKKVLCESLEDEIGSLIGEILSKSDNLHSYVFNQYSPHFNDGDPCTFNANHQYGEFYGEVVLDEDGEPDDDPEGLEYSDIITERDTVMMKQIKDMLKQIPDDFYLDMWGDGSEISFFRNGEFEVDDDYEHD